MAANISILVLAIEIMIIIFALLVGVIVAGISVVESTVLTRRFLRGKADTAGKINDRVSDIASKQILPRLITAEKYSAWVSTFVRSLKNGGQS